MGKWHHICVSITSKKKEKIHILVPFCCWELSYLKMEDIRWNEAPCRITTIRISPYVWVDSGNLIAVAHTAWKHTWSYSVACSFTCTYTTYTLLHYMGSIIQGKDEIKKKKLKIPWKLLGYRVDRKWTECQCDACSAITAFTLHRGTLDCFTESSLTFWLAHCLDPRWRQNDKYRASAWRNQIYYWSLRLNNGTQKWCWPTTK